MPRTTAYIASTFSLLLLCNCATIITGREQSIQIQTGNVSNASCILYNAKGTWTASTTPTYVTVLRSETGLNITCSKAGYNDAKMTVNPKKNTLTSFVGGGLIGYAIDNGSDSIFEYPSVIMLPLDKKNG